MSNNFLELRHFLYQRCIMNNEAIDETVKFVSDMLEQARKETIEAQTIKK